MRSHVHISIYRFLDREEDMTPPPRKPRPRRVRRKIRLAQTAPPQTNPSENPDNLVHPGRKAANSGPETQAEKEQMLKMTRKKSMFLHLPGMGSKGDLRSSDETPTPFAVPRPNPKTLLDVMIGLNAFSQLPPSESYDPFRGDSRVSIDQESYYGSHEHIAKNFMLQWKNRVACRKPSLINRLDSSHVSYDFANHRCESTNLSSVPEGPASASRFKRRKSKWSMRTGMKQPTLPSIDDEDERKHQFMAWVQDERQKMRSEKSSIFANICPNDKQSVRRKSFTLWLQKRQEQKADLDDNSDDDMGALRDISEDEEDNEPESMGDLMKTILKIKTRFKDSLDSRVKRFNNEMEKIKKRDEEHRKKPISNSQKRRFKMLLEGIDAALADSSDDEDNYYTPT